MDASVIVPCHNEASTLGAQLDALACQEWSGTWEVIVVDNGSDDDTPEIARRHEALGDRIVVVEARNGRGAAYARRCGVERARSDLLLFCDGDDTVGPGWLAALADALKSSDLVTGDIDSIALNEAHLAATRGPDRPGVAPTFAGTPFVRSNNCGMSRRVWDAFGGFDEDFPGLEDIEFGLRAAARCQKVEFVPEAVVQYRYRRDFRSLVRQGRFYGASVPFLDERCRELGLARPARFAGWRSYVWIAAHLPLLYRRSVRWRIIWSISYRWGVLSQSVRCRHLMI